MEEELMGNLGYETPQSDTKRQKLLECVLTGNSKMYLGKVYTEEQLAKLNEEEVEKLFNNYEAKLSGQMVKSLGNICYIRRTSCKHGIGCSIYDWAIASGIISVLAKKYPKKLKKVTRLIDIVTPALVVFERVISGALKNGVIDEEEFNTLQTLHLETLNELTGVDRRMEAENRSLVGKSLIEEINGLKKKAETKA